MANHPRRISRSRILSLLRNNPVAADINMIAGALYPGCDEETQRAVARVLDDMCIRGQLQSQYIVGCWQFYV